MRLKLSDLQPGQDYAIQVRGADGLGEFSEWSAIYNFTTATNADAPVVPTGTTWAVSGDEFIGEWNPVSTTLSGSLAVIKFYEIELVGAPTTKIVSVPAKTDGSKLSYTLSFEDNRAFFGTPKPTVTFRVRAVDASNLKSDWSSVLSVSNPAPSAPTSAVVKEVVDGIDISWTPPADTDLIGYSVYVGTTAGFTPNAGNRVYRGNTQNFLYASTTYSLQYFKIRALDKFSQESTDLTAQGTPVSPFTVDVTAPALPTGVTAPIVNSTNGVGATANVSWTHAGASDLAGFNVRWRKVGDTVYFQTAVDKDTRSATVDLPLAYTNYEFQVRAFDWSANYSAWTATVTSTSPSNAAPAQVTGVGIVAGKQDVKVTWTANTEPDLANYEVQIATNSGFSAGLLTYRVAGTTLSVTGLSTNTQYWTRVRAFDTGGQAGTYSTSANATTSDYPVGSASDGFAPGSSPTPSVMSGIGYLYATWAAVTLNSNGGAQVDPVTYDVHLSTSSGFTPAADTKVTEVSGTFAVIDVLPGTTTPLTYGTTYYVKLVARDRDGSAAAGAQGSGTPAKVASTDSTLTAGDVGAATPSYVDQAELDAIATSGTNADTKITNYNTNTVQPALNGKNKITHSTAVPGTASNIAGDTWIQYDGSNQIIGQWRGTGGTSWVAETINNAFIANLDAAKINTGTLDVANRVAAGSVSTSKLLVGDFTNLIDNPHFVNGTSGWSGGFTVVTDTLPDGQSGPVAQLSGNGTVQDANANKITVKPGDSFYVSGWVRKKTAGADNDGTIGFAATLLQTSGVYLYPAFSLVNVSTLTVGVWQKLQGVVTIGSLGGTLNFRFTLRNDVADGVYQFSTLEMRRRNEGELIVDGAISANKVSAGTYTGGNFIIGAGGSFRSANYVAGTTGFNLSDTGLEVRSGTVAANTLISGTGVINDLIINTGGSIQSANYVAGTTGFRIDNSSFNLGSNGTINAGALKAGTVTATTINIGATGVLNVDSTGSIKSNNYSGSFNATSGTGWSLSSSGLVINDGSVSAKALKSSTLATATISLATDGVIQTTGYNGTSGFSLSGSGLVIKTGTIEAAALQIQAGAQNLLPSQYSGFEFPSTFYSTLVSVGNGASGSASISTTQKWEGVQSLRISQTTTTTANGLVEYGGLPVIPVEPNKTYIISMYVYQEAGTANDTTVMAVVDGSGNGGTYRAPTGGSGGNITITAINTWQRLTWYFTTGASETGVRIKPRVTNPSTTARTNRLFYFDGIMIEQRMGSLNTASTYTSGGITEIDGGFIKTGSIQSSATTTVNGATVPLWSINTTGSASFANAQIRGNTVVGVSGTQDGAASQIASGNYSAGTTGWIIRSDGYAEFRNLASDSIRSDLLTVGNRHSESVLVNSTFEDKGITNNSVDSNKFAGWVIVSPVGTSATMTEETAAPISGSRSMKLAFANATAGCSIANQVSHPVVAGDRWEFSAHLRPSVALSKTEASTTPYAFTVWMHVSKDILTDPLTATTTLVDTGAEQYYQNAADTVRRYEVAKATAASAGTTFELTGGATIPAGFTMMKMSVEVAPSETTAWDVILDDVRASLSLQGITVYGADPVNPVASINGLGVGSFQELTAPKVTVDAEGLIISGAPSSESFTSDLLAAVTDITIADVPITQVIRTNYRLKYAATKTSSVNSMNSGSTTAAFLDGSFNSTGGHTYRITVTFTARSTTTEQAWDTKMHYRTDGALATANNTVVEGSTYRWNTHALSNRANTQTITFYWHIINDGQINWCLANHQIQTGSVEVLFSSPYQPQVFIEDMGLTAGIGTTLNQRNKSTGSDDTDNTPPPSDTSLTKYTKTWNATWSRGYNGSGSQISSGSNHKQGYYSSTNGNTKAAVGFDDADIRSKLNGVTNANIVKTEVYLYFNHWYNNAGGTAVLGTHNSSTAQSTWGGLSGVTADRQRSTDWPKPGGRWVTVPNLWAQEFRDASSRGVVVGPGPSTSTTYYGTFNGSAQSNVPKIRITYKK